MLNTKIYHCRKLFYLATPLYLDTPLEKPLLLLKTNRKANCINDILLESLLINYFLAGGVVGMRYLLKEAKYSSLVTVFIISISFSYSEPARISHQRQPELRKDFMVERHNERKISKFMLRGNLYKLMFPNT